MKITNFVTGIGSVISLRGKAYWKEGRVDVEIAEEDFYRATVHGTSDYTTAVELKGNEIVRTYCNCPYGRNCKHVAALLYEIRERRKSADKKVSAPACQEKKIVFYNTEMTEKELFYLCYEAFSDYVSIYLQGYVPVNSWRFSRSEQIEYAYHLQKTGWLEERYTHFRDVTQVSCRTENVIYILRELVANHPDWLLYFQQKCGGNCRLTPYVIGFLEVLLGKKDKAENPLRNDTIWQKNHKWFSDILIPLLDTEDPILLHDLLPEPILYGALVQKLYDTVKEEDLVALSHIGQVLSALAPYATPFWWHTCMNYRLDVFLCTGVELSPTDKKPLSKEMPCSYYDMEAIHRLYENKLDEAILLFQQGLKTAKMPSPWNIMPIDELPCLCYVIALGRRRTEADVEVLRKILKKSKDDDTHHLRPVFALVNFFQSTTQEKDLYSLYDTLKSATSTPLARSIATLILYFFGKQDVCNGLASTSHIALLQGELSAYTDEQTTWPYPSALQQVPVYEPWELELEEILHNAQAACCSTVEKKAERTPAETRLIYCYDGYSPMVEVREQPRLKNGEWGKGKRVSAARYANGDAHTDDLDKAIYAEWRKTPRRYSYQPYPMVLSILPAVKGTDRLYLDNGETFAPISVREEQPFLFTRRNGDSIIFSSNISSEMESYDNIWVDRTDPKKWVYYTLPEEKHALFERILQLGTVPAKAEPMLQKLFGVLQGQIEVHSDVEGAEAIAQVEGQTQPTLRITPDGDTYILELCLYPLEGSMQSVFPTAGVERYYDQQDGKRVEVVRRITGERRALKQVNAFLSEQLGWGTFSISVPERDINMVQLLQLLQVAPEQATLFHIEWRKGEKITVHQADASSWHIAAHKKGGWFDIEGEIPLSDGHVLTMAQLLAMLRESDGNYIRLSDTDFVTISDALRRQLERIEAVAQTRGGKVQIPELAMTVLGGSLQGEMEIDEPDTLLRMRERIRESEQLPFAVPDSLNATLRDYQIDGFRWMMRLHHWGAGACLADDMGLGKTIQTIAVLLAHAQEGVQMVVAPASVVGNWQREIARFAPSLNTLVLNDFAADDRKQALDQLRAGDVLVLTYGLLVSERITLTPHEWTTVCLDEAHTIKNRDTKSSAAAMQLQAKNRIILTGTPIQNHLGELWNLMQFVNPGLLGSYDHFTEYFVNPIAAGMDEPKQQLKRLIAPFTLRRSKQEVARELPDKMEIQVPVVLSEDEMAVYEVLRREAKAQLETDASVSANTLSMITRLREAACSVALVEKNWTGESSKLDVMLDKLQSMLQQENRVLIFSQFTSFLKMAKQTIGQAGITDILYLDGSTPIKERQRMVEAFQAGKGRVFLISLKAGGLGLNLTGANYVIHLDPWWNPAIEQQATDRAYRIGQKQKVTVYHLIAEHTIEEKILRLHQTKQSLADSLLDGTNLSHRLTAQDLLALLS